MNTVPILFSDQTITGYVSNLSPIQIAIKNDKLTNKKKETKWFEFDFHSETTVRRVVSFSPEKRKLLQSIVDSTNEGCEIKKSRNAASDDIIINQHSAIKKIKPSFPKHDQNIPISTLTAVVNELPLYKRVAVVGMVYNISQEIEDKKGERILKYKRATLKDNQDSIAIQLINPNIFNTVEEKKIYRLNHMMISIFEQEKYLKSTQVTTVSPAPDTQIEPPLAAEMLKVKNFLKYLNSINFWNKFYEL